MCRRKEKRELPNLKRDAVQKQIVWGGRFPSTGYPAPEDKALVDPRWSEYGWD